VADELRVAASESDLILLARALIAPHPVEVRAMIWRMRAMPPAISTACAALLGDALSHVWPALWRRGGRSRGRFWERHAPVGLTFSGATLELLRGLVSVRGSSQAAPPRSLTLGDQIMVYFALDATHGTPAGTRLAAEPVVRAAPLAWLGFADVLGDATGVEFDGLCGGAGALVVEALGDDLARRWQTVELHKRASVAPDALIALGAAQDATLRGFMAACDRHARRDLAGFVIDAAAPLLQRGVSPMPVRLDPAATLGRRATARVAAGALLRAVMTWAVWDQAHRGVRFIDDDYAAAQALLARFETIGAAGRARAEAWLTELASLAPTPGPAPVLQ